ncbi:MAG: hypothetical protein PHX78_08385 [bacterium]|nr:hypothetical protein [bacterium]
MNKRILILIVFLVLVNCFFTVKASNDTASDLQANDTTKSGLIMQIASDRKKYQPFQPINIRITVINNTPNEVIFNKRFAVIKQQGAEVKSDISFKITKPNGGNANIEFASEVAPLSETDFVKIKSKGKYEKQLAVNTWYWKELGASGPYAFKCIYHNDMSGYLMSGDDGDKLMEMYAWTGDLESNAITFNIDEMSKDEVAKLTARLTNESIYWGERSKVAELLGDLKNGWALDSLLSRLVLSENEVVRNKCVEAIVKYGAFPIKRLIKLLDNADPMSRVLSAKILCLLGEKKGLGVVRKELQNKDGQVVMEAMLALQCLDKDLAIKDIVKYDLLNSKEDILSFTAMDILKKLGVKVDFNKKLNKWAVVK